MLQHCPTVCLLRMLFEPWEPAPMEPCSPCRENPKTSQTSQVSSVHEQLHLQYTPALTSPKQEGNQQYCPQIHGDKTTHQTRYSSSLYFTWLLITFLAMELVGFFVLELWQIGLMLLR